MFFLVSVTILFRICVLGQEGHQKQELRIAWLAPRESFRGITAESSVNVLKYGLRTAEYQFLKNHNIKQVPQVVVFRYVPNCNVKKKLNTMDKTVLESLKNHFTKQ
ncbi:hypothetical protein Btru_006450 [Bulinus truncatus]|nr:hypothetical protein Btru_006450 [Bulinus truncatus]